MANLGTFNNSDLKQIAELIDAGGAGIDYSPVLAAINTNTGISAANSRGVLGTEIIAFFTENQSLPVCATWIQSQGATPGNRLIACNILPSSDTPGLYSAFVIMVNS